MIIKLSNVKSDQESIFELIAHLKNLNLQRNRQIQEFRFDGDPTVEELLNVSTPISFRIKPEKYEMDNIEWGNLVALTTIDYMKKFNFMNILELKDRVLVVQNAFSDFDMFSHAFRALEAKKAEISYPDNSEIFMKMEPVICESLEKSIKCKLPGRLGELKITTEEFLLLASIFFCNPAISKLSDSGKITLSFYQNLYTSCLLQYCLLSYQNNGPCRFTDLLLLYPSIKKTHEEIGYHYFLCKTRIRNLPFKKLYDHEMLQL
ncbi:hypothetical protein L5515_009253 [Caenorhabditis briggsae]|uniref:NR LBD domain-containing protein n=1 Tax=Caenorhabditis briggsae TaxID=6238 RepID=A0AAE9F9G4_CAEBR|nr:hypothetical protein L5515_009253 [Caenorhabditis briggsae]